MAISESLCVDGVRRPPRNKERLTIEIPKEAKDAYRQMAGKFGMSLTQLVQVAVEEYAKNHANEVQGDGVESAT